MPSEFSQRVNTKAEMILDLLGIKYRKSGIWLQTACPIHGGDNPIGFGVNMRSGRWSCFTHHCHDGIKNDMLGLIACMLKIGRRDAVSWVYNHIDIDSIALIPDQQENRQTLIYPECCLKRLLYTDYYRKKNFSEETCKFFEHGEAQSRQLRNRVVFPIRNERGFIIGFSGRWLGKQEMVNGKLVCTSGKQIVAKWKHFGFQKGLFLYNFSNAKDSSHDEIIVVESIGNVMRWYDAGFRNVVACLGSSLTNVQRNILIANSKFAIIAFDGDDAGKKGAQKCVAELEKFMDCAALFPPDGKDWADITNEETIQLYKNVRREKVF